MKTAEAHKLHPLADPQHKAGQIVFLHAADNTQHTLTSVVNSLSGDRLTWWDDESPDVHLTAAEVKRIFKDITARAAKVISCVGDFCPRIDKGGGK